MIGFRIAALALAVVVGLPPQAQAQQNLMDQLKGASSAPLDAWTFKRAVRSRPYWALTAVHFITAISGG